MNLKLYLIGFIIHTTSYSQIRIDSIFWTTQVTDVFFEQTTKCNIYFTRNDGSIFKECYYSNGQKAYSANLMNGIANGQVVIYYPNGARESIRSYVLGVEIGTWIEWYENGNIKSWGSFSKFKRDSLPTKLLYDTAFVDSSMFKITYEISTHYNTKDGGWHYYNESGTEEIIMLYRDGILMEQKKIHY